ncbi:RteC domain-containing protein [Pedobacter psychrodurus]|uniref:RteC domain-containing protein n=1 Tax=Pedobacter psychrodurus TaxID=2530456 RepID=UPI002930CD93|nr:RteC domain-containing protein [Pedobacter psychrodurus]
MKETLEKLEEEKDTKLEVLKRSILTVQKYLDELKELVDRYAFANEDEEIWFFKSEKPRFYRWLIFYSELLNIESTKPIAREGKIKDHYREQMRYINCFFRSYEFQYQYYRLGTDELDHLFFLRGGCSKDIRLSSIPRIDPSFGTGHEYLFSRFKACEMLQKHLTGLLIKQQYAGSVDKQRNVDSSRLRWTGDSLNLIEVLYGLYSTGQINNGKIGLSEIAEVFQHVFQINLNRYHRRFVEIKQRKGMSKTRFLDEMRDGILKKVDESDSFGPEKGR